MRYAYFPGCSLESTSSEYDLSLREISKVLNVKLEEIPDWICCGSSPAHLINKNLSITLPVQNLIWPEKEKLDVIAPCASCFSRLKLSNIEIQNNLERKKEINKILGADYQGNVKVLNILDLLNEKLIIDEIKKNVKKKLTGLKVACYYGCLMTRPPEIKAEHIENPVLMDNICNILGAESIDWACKTDCCGASFSISKSEIMIKLSHDILDMAKAAEADCIIVSCPLCQSNLDVRQSKIEEKYKTKFDIPVIYITQLVGLAFGISPKKLGLNKLFVSPENLLKSKGIIK